MMISLVPLDQWERGKKEKENNNQLLHALLFNPSSVSCVNSLTHNIVVICKQ